MDSPPSIRSHQLEAIFREHAPFVLRTLERFGFGHSDADDLCQEVFLVVHNRIRDFENRSTLRTWIYGITAKVASAHRRRAWVRRERSAALAAEGVAPSDPCTELEHRQALALLDRALSSLSAGKREAFALFELEEMTAREIADALGCPEKTIVSRVLAARREISAFVAREGQREVNRGAVKSRAQGWLSHD